MELTEEVLLGQAHQHALKDAMLRAEGVIRTGSLVRQKRQRSELGYIPAKSGISSCSASGRAPDLDLNVHDKGSFHGLAPDPNLNVHGTAAFYGQEPNPHLNIHETAAFHGQAPDPDLNVHGIAAFYGQEPNPHLNVHETAAFYG